MTTYLVVGLGNPGPTYASHRHNVGYLVVNALAGRARATFASKRLMRADLCETRLAASGIGGIAADAHKVVLLKSHTYMNDTGIAVKKASDFYKVEPGNIVAIHDELDIDFATLRLKLGGGDNGHNGLRSMRAHLGTGDFFRVRFGIGRPPGRQDPADFVLSNFAASQRDDLAEAVERAADAVETLLLTGLAEAQNRFNS